MCVLCIPTMTEKEDKRGRQQLNAFVDDASMDGSLRHVFADFPAHLTTADALWTLLEVASLDAGLSVETYVANMFDGRPKEWEPSKNVGGAPPKIEWVQEYGRTAFALEASAALRLHLAKRYPGERRFCDPTPMARTMSAAREVTLRRAREKTGRGARPDATIKQHAESLRQAVRGKPERN